MAENDETTSTWLKAARSGFWNSTTCVRCEKKIGRGEPRLLVFALGFGFNPREILQTFCDVCAGEEQEFVLTNPWHGQQPGTPDSPELLEKSNCDCCQRAIKAGEPRVIFSVQELGYHQSHRDYSDLEEESVGSFRIAFTFCPACMGGQTVFRSLNILHCWREMRAADDPGRSVRSVSISYFTSTSEKESDWSEYLAHLAEHGRGARKLLKRFTQLEQEDLKFSEFSENDPRRAPPSREERWQRLQRKVWDPARGALTGPLENLRGTPRRVVRLYFLGKTQAEIARACRISQATVSRIITDAEKEAGLFQPRKDKQRQAGSVRQPTPDQIAEANRLLREKGQGAVKEYLDRLRHE